MNEFVIENTDKEEGRIERVKIKDFAAANELKCYNGDAHASLTFSTVSVSRPGLFLTGFEEYFAATRIQLMGNAEIYYLFGQTKERRAEVLDRLFSRGIPCLILSRGLKPTQDIAEAAKKHNVPIFLSGRTTSDIANMVITYLNKLLAPSVDMHGVLLNVDGMGVLLVGDSGIGKSETALELVRRGHMLVSDDSVTIKRVGDSAYGQSPKITQGFLEIRGVGIVDVERLFGVEALQNVKRIDLVIELERWVEDKQYDRIGRETSLINILGLQLPKIVVPVTAGRNLAIVIEAAALNHHLRQSGYIAADELDKRIKNS